MLAATQVTPKLLFMRNLEKQLHAFITQYLQMKKTRVSANYLVE